MHLHVELKCHVRTHIAVPFKGGVIDAGSKHLENFDVAGVEQVKGAINIYDPGTGRGHLTFAELHRYTPI